MSRMSVAALALAAVLTSGCFKTQYEFGGAAAGSPHKEMPIALVFGLAELEKVAINDLCPTGVARVEEEVGLIDGIIGWLTGNLVVTHTVQVYCAGGAAWDVELEGDRVIAAAPAR